MPSLLRIHHRFPARQAQTAAADRHLSERTRTWKEGGGGIAAARVELADVHQRFLNYLQTKLKRGRRRVSVRLAASPTGGQVKRIKELFFSPPAHDCEAGPRRGSSGVASYLTRRFRRHFKRNLRRESDAIEPRVLTVEDLPVRTSRH